MDNERLIDAQPASDDLAADNAIRPRSLEEYIGQPVVREQMEIFVSAARRRGEALTTS